MPALQSILELFSAHRAPQKPLGNPPLARPLQDWALVIISASVTLVLLGSAALGVYFWVAWGSEQSQDGGAVPESTLNAAKLNSLLTLYAAYEKEHADLLSKPPVVVDPAR